MCRRMKYPQKGMALVIVLWLVAALTIFVAGLSQSAKREIKLASLSRDLVTARAVGEAAVFELLLKMKLNPQDFQKIQKEHISYENYDIDLEIQPWNGLVDINSAPPGLLALLMQNAAGLSEREAKQISENIVKARDIKQPQKSFSSWESIDDILKIDGMNYNIFSSIKDFIVAGKTNSRSINKSSAKAPLSEWLESGDWVNFSSDNGRSEFFDIVASVYIGDGSGKFVIARSVRLANSSRGLPWTILSSKNNHRLIYNN